MSDIMIVIPGKPCAWQRARSNGKVRFDSPEQARNKLTISQIGAEAMRGRAPLEGPIEVIVAAFWLYPKSMTKKRRGTYGAHFFTSRPDADNIMKLIGDALNGIVWRDDAQIVTVQVSKRYAITQQTVIRVIPLREEHID